MCDANQPPEELDDEEAQDLPPNAGPTVMGLSVFPFDLQGELSDLRAGQQELAREIRRLSRFITGGGASKIQKALKPGTNVEVGLASGVNFEGVVQWLDRDGFCLKTQEKPEEEIVVFFNVVTFIRMLSGSTPPEKSKGMYL